MERLYRLLEPLVKWQNILIGVIFIILINAVFFPQSDRKRKSVAPEAQPILDLQYAYSPEEAYSALDSFGENGRNQYLKSVFLIDTAYPLIYGITYSLLLIFLLKIVFPNRKNLHRWGILPIAVSILDVLENTGIVLLLATYPVRHDGIALATSVFTTLKWTLAILLIIFLIVLSLVWILRRKQIRT